MNSTNNHAVTGRRRYVRVAPLADEPIAVDINGADFIDVLCALDISEGGLGIRVAHCFRQCRIDERVPMIVTLPKPVDASISVSGRIRHLSGERFGVQFVDLAPRDRRLIQRYVKFRLRIPGFWRGMLDRLSALATSPDQG